MLELASEVRGDWFGVKKGISLSSSDESKPSRSDSSSDMARGRRWLMLTTAEIDGVGAIWLACAPARDRPAAATGAAGAALRLGLVDWLLGQWISFRLE